MKIFSHYRNPERNERKALVCKKCGNRFHGVKIPFFTKCPRCGGRRVTEDPWVCY